MIDNKNLKTGKDPGAAYEKKHGSANKSVLLWIVIDIVLAVVLLGTMITVFSYHNKSKTDSGAGHTGTQVEKQETGHTKGNTADSSIPDESTKTKPAGSEQSAENQKKDKEMVVSWDESWQYAEYSKIHTSDVTLYRAEKPGKNITVALNAGHGTSGGSSVKTQCHPDGSPKLITGSTAKGETMAAAVATGTTMLDGSTESSATLALALAMKEDLLNAGYDVLMIRESEDVQLDNIARTVMANQYADCHIALHYDASDSDKGLFYIDVPDAASYRSMEPVASHWQEHHALGEAILSGMRLKNVKVYGSGSMAMDLTQTSYSTIPSIDLEVGDRASDLSESTVKALSKGLLEGLDQFFK